MQQSAPKNALPRWRGFNLLEMYKVAGNRPFSEDDFRWISDWGFDFVRLPLSYTQWIKNHDPGQIEEESPGFTRLDQALGWGERYGLHVSLNLHRAPGYCVNTERREPFDLWRDSEAQDAFCFHWEVLARRYRGVDPARLSFDLLNEPPRPWPSWTGRFSRRQHARVMRKVCATIRAVDPKRLLILDGLNYGRMPCPELADLSGVAQSCRAYEPFELSHYRANWVTQAGRWREPTWPLRRNHLGRRWTRARLEKVYAPWVELMRTGVGVHCGEAGCYRHTSHAVFLAWFEEVLSVLTQHEIGWALWNFRGPFGVLDTERTDVRYVDWHGHALDGALLKLLQRF